MVCAGCGGALGDGVRFCSSCGAAAPKESREPVAVARGGGGLLGRTLLAEGPVATSETVSRRLADEGWAVDAPTARGLASRRTAPARQPLPPAVDVATREELMTLLLSDQATARPRERSRLARLLGSRHGR